MTWTAEAAQRALAVLQEPCLPSLQLLDASSVAAQHYPHLDPGQPAMLVGPIEGRQLGPLARCLAQAYPPAHPVALYSADACRSLSVADLAEANEDADFLYVRPLPHAASFEALQDIIAHLRAPEGCPWDRALTWAKLRSTLLEESYELLAALDDDDEVKVAEELGDLLLQIAMQTQIAAEEDRFRLPDVIEHVVSKLIRRHPHVFGDTAVSGTDEVLANWEAIKRAERANNGGEQSPLSGVPAGLPALAQADAYQERVSRIRPAAADPGASQPMPEERNLETEDPWAALVGLAEPQGSRVTPEILGDALFRLVAWARARGLDAESALRETNQRYAARIATHGQTERASPRGGSK